MAGCHLSAVPITDMVVAAMGFSYGHTVYRLFSRLVASVSISCHKRAGEWEWQGWKYW